ncbi:MAG: DUF547 domain-containing protein [Moraxellaceae bacterium]|nr:MAG: DUF547 domain-containing protein [Moraxellaceae bacterium]
MKLTYTSILLAVIVFFSLPLTTSNVDAADFDHQQWNDLVSTHVLMINQDSASQVNYQGLSANRSQLKNYLSNLAAIPLKTFNGWSHNAQLAFLLNAYNAWTVELILTQYPDIKSIKDLGSFFRSPWKKKFIPLLEKNRSLDDIEHNLIRGSDRYHEPRIHFAANCASIGCPALLTEAFEADKLESQLDKATRAFLRDRSRNRLKDGNLEVSSIFDWYKADFEKGWRGLDDLPSFLASYHQDLGLNQQQTQALIREDIEIEFLNYDWNLNRTP